MFKEPFTRKFDSCLPIMERERRFDYLIVMKGSSFLLFPSHNILQEFQQIRLCLPITLFLK